MFTITTAMLLMGGAAALMGALFETIVTAGLVDAVVVAGATAAVALTQREGR